MKTIIFYGSIFLILSVFVKCSKSNENPDFINMAFPETQCANPWGSGFEIESIEFWLATEGISPQEIYRKQTSPDNIVVCMACTCGNGWTTFIFINPEDIDKAIDLGFLPVVNAL